MERFIDLLLKNRIMIMILTALVISAGIYSYNKLNIEAFPDVSPNLVQVFTITEGLAPEEIEKYITYPLEVSMNGLPNLKKIRSVSNFGLSVVNIYFEDDADIYFSRQLVNERIQEAKEQIPDGFGEPAMGPISTGMGLIMFYYLEDETGKYSLSELRDIQDWIVKFQLQSVNGVTEVLGIGGWEKQFQVNVNPVALLRYKLTIESIKEKIEENNLNVGAQFIERNSEEYLIRSVGLAKNISDLEKIVVKNEDGLPIFLSQIATIENGGAIRRGAQTKDGVKEVISGMIVKLFGTNSSVVIKDVEKKLDEINNLLPEGIKIIPYYEQKSIVEAAVNTVSEALLQGIIFVVIILIIFMGSIRASIVVAASIPFSLMVAFIGMNYFDLTVNLMSFGGLTIAIGMMVDASIVLVENIDRLLNENTSNESNYKKIITAGVQVIRPIVFSISIIIIVFLPLFTLQGVEGKTFRPLAYTISMAMVGSLFYAIIIAPVVSLLLMKSKKKKNVRKGLDQIILNLLTRIYKPILELFIKYRMLSVSLAGIIILIGVLIFPRLGSEFTPTLQEGTMVLRLTMAPSISLEQSTEYTMIAERKLMKIPEIKSVVSRIGRGEVGAHTDPVNSAEMFIILNPEDTWRAEINKNNLSQTIRKDFGEMAGVLTNFTQPIQMTVDELLEGIRAELAIKLYGDDLRVLKATAEKISETIGAINGATDVQVDQIDGTPQVKIEVDKDAIARYGINIADVQNTIKIAIGGDVAGYIYEGNKRYEIFVRLQEKYRNTVDAISELRVNVDNLSIPLSELVNIEEIVGPRQITREQNQRFITIQCNVEERDIGSFVEEGQTAISENVKLPAGYFVSWGGQYKLQQEANKRFAVVIPITLLIISILLFMSFKSFKKAALIIINIPLALVGGIISLYITGANLSVPASIGFIALFGIALENAMVLISYIGELRERGSGIDAASLNGALLRLRPVIMTAFTTAIGLMPLLLSSGTGSEIQKPLATVVIGGIFTSTLLTLLVLPSLYKWFDDKKVIAK